MQFAAGPRGLEIVYRVISTPPWSFEREILKGNVESQVCKRLAMKTIPLVRGGIQDESEVWLKSKSTGKKSCCKIRPLAAKK